MTGLLVAFSGGLADRWGRRRFLIAGTLLPSIGLRRILAKRALIGGDPLPAPGGYGAS